MKNNITNHDLDLTDLESRERIKKLIDLYYEQKQILNQDSKESIEGGAVCYYKVKLEFEEIWI